MSTGDARRIQSANALNFGRKQGESSNQRSYTRQQEEIEDPNPAVIVGQADPFLLSPFSTQTYDHNTDALAIKVNRFEKKSA